MDISMAIGILVGMLVMGLFIAWCLRTNELPYAYHVSYNIKGKDGFALGSMTINRNKRIKTSGDVEMLGAFIRKETDSDSVVIIHWIPLQK